MLHRARQMADGGAERLFADVDPTVSWADNVLSIDKPHSRTSTSRSAACCSSPARSHGPTIVLVTDPKWQPTIAYPARGAATLWEPGRPAPPDALGALLGELRAGC